jgi:DNA polymerase-1
MTSPEDNGVIACDFSQVELRVAAAFADEPVLLDAFAQGRCPHTEVAAKMTGKAVEDVTQEERFKAKAVNFGILNGMGAKRLAFELKTDKGTAFRFLDEYKRNLPKLNSWMEGVWREAEEFRVARTVAGRTRIFTSLEDTRPAVSVIVQGSAAELIRHSLVAVHEAGLEPLLTVHDEILVGNADEAKAEKLRETMESAANEAYTDAFGSVKFTAEADLGGTWGDA